jgi:hypothetical protein
VAASEIHRLEQGLVRDPRSSRIVALAAALEVTTDLLLRGLGALPPAGELAGARADPVPGEEDERGQVSRA